MPRYFFHLVTPSTYYADDIGAEFETAEAAYLDASRAAVELSIEALRRRETTTGHRFEIMDDHGQLLFDLPFNEMVRSRGSNPFQSNLALRRQLDDGLRRSRDLQASVAAELARARENLKATRALLRRSAHNF
jgi:hypothetical protein